MNATSHTSSGATQRASRIFAPVGRPMVSKGDAGRSSRTSLFSNASVRAGSRCRPCRRTAAALHRRRCQATRAEAAQHRPLVAADHEPCRSTHLIFCQGAARAGPVGRRATSETMPDPRGTPPRRRRRRRRPRGRPRETAAAGPPPAPQPCLRSISGSGVRSAVEMDDVEREEGGRRATHRVHAGAPPAARWRAHRRSARS